MANFRRVSRFGVVNAYLVREEDGLTVIDAAPELGAKMPEVRGGALTV